MLESIQSPLIEPVSKSDLLAMLRSALDEEIMLTEHRQITGGLFNTSYYVATRQPDYEIIVRIAPPKQKHPTLFEYEQTMMSTEPAIYEIMRDHGIPVPDVLAIDTTGHVIPRDVILLRYLDSVQLNHPDIPDDTKTLLQRKLGATIRQMHAITHDRFGRIDAGGAVNGNKSWRVVFEGFFTEAIELCGSHDLFDPEVLAKASEYLEKHAGVLDDDAIRPALVHGDMWDANVLVTRNETADWEIGAIIDVDRALFADSEFEGALWYSTDAFHEGYGKPLDDSRDGKMRRTLYHLYSDLFHVFVFGIQIPVPEYVERHRTNIYELLG